MKAMIDIFLETLIKIKSLLSFFIFAGISILNVSSGLAEVSFLALGDSPYSDREFYLIEQEIKIIPKKPKFLIHLGDMKRLSMKCEEDDYEDFAELLKVSPIPIFIIPGDNDYSSCKNKFRAKGFWDKYVLKFEKHWDIDFDFNRQENQKENFSFFIEGNLFVGIKLFKKEDANINEFNELLEKNIWWIKENIRKYQRQIKSMVVFAHDFSGLRKENDTLYVCQRININAWAQYKNYKYFSDQFVELAKEFNKPILYMHGNHHCWANDFPYKEAQNIERIVVDKIENSPFIKITIKDEGFLIDRREMARISSFIEDAHLGDIWAQYILGEEYLDIKDFANAKKWLEKSAEKNFLPAKLKLAMLFIETKEFSLAYELFKSLVEGESPSYRDPENNYQKKQSSSYKRRIERFKNPPKENFSAIAKFNLGNMYYVGLGRPKDYKKALNYYKEASKGGIANAAYNIGLFYYKGTGIGKDLKKAVIWFNKAAEKFCQPAFYKLGMIYLKGQGVKQSYKDAAKWFRLARGDGPSLYNLGILYFKGLGVKEDRAVAIKNFKNAALLGSKEAKEILKQFKKIPIFVKPADP